MLSGVGPASHLSEHGIPVVADISGVGSHLMDHLVVDLHFKDTSNTGLWFLKGSGFSAKMKLIKALLEYKYTQKGPLTTNVTSFFFFLATLFALCLMQFVVPGRRSCCFRSLGRPQSVFT